MATDFDPYHKWLAIPPESQPPNHYNLIGVHTFEDDPDVIANAADQRMVHLRTFQSGKRSKESQKLLNEVAAAKLVLLDPDKKADYDLALRKQVETAKEGTVRHLPGSPPERHQGRAEAGSTRRPTARSKATANRRLLIVGAGAGVLALLLIAGLWPLVSGCGSDSQSPPVVANGDKQPTEPSPSPTPPPPVSTPTQPAKSAHAQPQGTPPTTVSVSQMEKELSIDLGNGVKMEFMLIPPGEFTMGSPEPERQAALEAAKAQGLWSGYLEAISSEVQHRVRITKPFYLGKCEVTQAQWQAVMGDNPSVFREPSKPVDSVGWDAAQEFLTKLNSQFAKEGQEFHLPTEAQWEYACRAGTTTAFSFGDNAASANDYAWFKDNSDKKTHPVGQKKPNPWGLYDMHGNVSERCADWYGNDYYESCSQDDPSGPDSGERRVMRGGHFKAKPSRSANRSPAKPEAKSNNIGIRVAVSSKTIPAPIAEVPKPSTTAPDTTVAATTPPAVAAPDTRETTPPTTIPPTEQGADTTVAAAPQPQTVQSTKPADARLAIPPAAEQQKKLHELDEVYSFSDERTPAESVKLANELYNLGRQMKSDPAGKFALLRKAMEIASTGGDAALMLSIVDTMGTGFQIDVLPAKKKVLTDFASSPTRNSEQIRSFIEAADPVIDQALAEGRADIAVEIAEAAYGLSQLSAGRDFRKRTYSRRNDIRKMAALWKHFHDAQVALKTDPDNPEANLTVGRWLSFRQNDWVQGLPHLAKCSSDALKAVAAQEIASPAMPEVQVALADTWWALAEKAHEPEKKAIALHAGQWYAKASSGLTGVAKIKVDKRLAEIAKLGEVAVEKPEEPTTPSTPPRTPLKPQAQGTYLSDMEPFEVKKGPWGLKVVSEALPNGVVCAHSISLHPPSSGHAAAKYRLDGNFGRLRGGAMIVKSSRGGGAWSPVNFVVIGDGKGLWASIPTKQILQPQLFDVSVQGVQVLELRVNCAGVNERAHAVWLDPHLLGGKAPLKPAAVAPGGTVVPAPMQPHRVVRTGKTMVIDLPGRTKMEFVLIPAGEFLMGASEAERQLGVELAKTYRDRADRIAYEQPQHLVKISKPFYLGKYEVTQAQWQAVMGTNPSKFKGLLNPVEMVSWNDIQSFLEKLSMAFEKEGLKFGLPTEAQWEYACRAGTSTAFNFGNDPALLTQYAWFKGNAGGKTHPVGQRKPNAWGLCDMNGNVWERCSNWFAKDFYRLSPPVDPIGPDAGSEHTTRGGGWDVNPGRMRSSDRGQCPPNGRKPNLGFRIVCTAAER